MSPARVTKVEIFPDLIFPIEISLENGKAFDKRATLWVWLSKYLLLEVKQEKTQETS